MIYDMKKMFHYYCIFFSSIIVVDGYIVEYCKGAGVSSV